MVPQISGIHPLVLSSLLAAPPAAKPQTKEEAELERIQAETAKLNAEAEKARVEAANAKKDEPKKEERPVCDIRKGKWCHVIRVGANWRMVHPNAGNGVFETRDDPNGHPDPQYTYDPSSDGLFGALGVYGEYHNRWIRLGKAGPYLLAGVAFGWDKTKWELDKSDGPEGLDSKVRQVDWSVGVPIGVEIPVENNTGLRGISLVVTPRFVRTNYTADAQGVGQTEGVLITGTERNEDESGRALAPTVHRFPGLSTNSFGVDFEVRVHLSRWMDLTLGYGLRKTGDITTEIGDEGRLIARGIEPEDIPEDRRNIQIGVTPPNDQYFLIGFGGRFELLGGK